MIDLIETKHMFLECVDPNFKYLDCYKLLKEIDDSLIWVGKRVDYPDEAQRALERAEEAKRELETIIENTPTTGN